jgi:hypothetical protein
MFFRKKSTAEILKRIDEMPRIISLKSDLISSVINKEGDAYNFPKDLAHYLEISSYMLCYGIIFQVIGVIKDKKILNEVRAYTHALFIKKEEISRFYVSDENVDGFVNVFVHLNEQFNSPLQGDIKIHFGKKSIDLLGTHFDVNLDKNQYDFLVKLVTNVAWDGMGDLTAEAMNLNL